jgi:hypothetical protein
LKRAGPFGKLRDRFNPANQEIGVPKKKPFTRPFPSFSAKAGNPEIQAVKKRQPPNTVGGFEGIDAE